MDEKNHSIKGYRTLKWKKNGNNSDIISQINNIFPVII